MINGLKALPLNRRIGWCHQATFSLYSQDLLSPTSKNDYGGARRGAQHTSISPTRFLFLARS